MQLTRRVVVRRSHMRCLAAVCIAAFFGCSEYLGPERGDPAEYVIDNVRCSCGHWIPEAPDAEFALFDVLWPQGDPNDPFAGPSAAQRQAILDAGGTIVHTFNVPMIRAILPTAVIAERFREFVNVTGVPDAADFPVNVYVGFDPSGRSDIGPIIESFDGVINSVTTVVDAAAATVPDSSIPGLRDHPLTTSVFPVASGSCEGF